MASFSIDNAAYEDWLRTQCDVVDADLDYKHERMKKNAFVFFRATYFRWAKRIAQICPHLKDARQVLSVGDIHAENFGTWRDIEGRLVWGVNDFDEAATMAYPFDLVRLAASVQLSKFPLSKSSGAGAILDGYKAGLEAPRPTLLDEQETWMRPYVACSDDDRTSFWTEVDDYPDGDPPEPVARALLASVPDGASLQRFATRVKGGGSLGRPRFVLVANWRGGRIVREAKALVPSAWHWASGAVAKPIRFIDLARGSHRSPDPWLEVRNDYVLRRVAADSRKVNLADNDGSEMNAQLLTAMGFDLGALHAASQGAASNIRDDLIHRPTGWLNESAKAAVHAFEEDYAGWAR
jgi:hypothetical protein